MRKAIILHGTCDEEEFFEMDFPSSSNAHWLPWLQQKFLRAGVLCQTLQMPNLHKPKYEEWAETFEQLDWEDDAIIVGHSSGCGFILKWLHHNRDRRLEKLVMVAPYLDPQEKRGEFLQVKLDIAVQNKINSIHLLNSTNDGTDIQQTTEKILDTYTKVKLHEFKNMGHFCLKNTGPTFPALWDIAKPEIK